MRRVLQVTGSMNIGGAESVLMNLARALSVDEIRNMDFLVFGDTAGDYEPELSELGFRILRMPPPSIFHPMAFRAQMRGLLSDNGPYDVVHTHINFASGMVARVAKLHGVPQRIAHSHMTMYEEFGPLRSAYVHISRKMILRYSTDFTACGNDAGSFLFGPPWRLRGLIIPNAIDVQLFQNAAEAYKGLLHQQLELDAKTILVGSVARLVPIKNLGFLIDVLSEALAMGIPMHLVIVGEGPEHEAILALADSRGVAEHLTMLGLRRDIPELMAGFDVLAMPSVREGLPVSLIEAQASGLPAVVSTGVTQESSVVPGLIRFEDTASSSDWVRALVSQSEIEVEPKIILERLQASGYTIEAQVTSMRALYGWT